MLSYYLKCKKKKKNTRSINAVNAKSSNGGTIILSKCAVCNIKKCGENAKSISPQVSKAINGGTKISKCVACGSKKARFVKKQEAKVLLSNLGIRKLLSNILILRDVLF